MNIKPWIVVVVLVLISVGLSGCTNEDNGNENSDLAKFVGTWSHGSESSLMKYTFYSNGTYTHGSTNGTYKIEKEQLVLHGLAKLRYEYLFSDDYNTLSITIVGSEVVNWVFTREE